PAACADGSSPATRRPLSARANRLHVRIFFSLHVRRVSAGGAPAPRRPAARCRILHNAMAWCQATGPRFFILISSSVHADGCLEEWTIEQDQRWRRPALPCYASPLRARLPRG